MAKVKTKMIILGSILVLSGVISGIISIFKMSYDQMEWVWIAFTSVASTLAGVMIVDEYF